ncbi:hypothetical protein ACHAQI_004355 [Fusarium lateritium]
MFEQPAISLLSVGDKLPSLDKTDMTLQTNERISHSDTSPEPTRSDGATPWHGEETNTGPSNLYSSMTPELISQFCVSTAMATELGHEWMAKRLQVAESPYEYILTLPSKGVRGAFIDALNVWFEAPADKTAAIKEVVGMLHDSSLMIDDFQDNSPLRRGKPSAHSVFGPAQAINSATYIIVKAIGRVQQIANPALLTRVTATVMTIFQGQAMDLSWTFNNSPPSIQSYLLMVNDKTGALFRLACELLVPNAQIPLDNNLLEHVSCMVSLLGQYFQIRDDYQNLTNLDVSSLKRRLMMYLPSIPTIMR